MLNPSESRREDLIHAPLLNGDTAVTGWQVTWHAVGVPERPEPHPTRGSHVAALHVSADQ